MTRLFLIAAEPSGDALGADFIAAVRAILPDVEIAGIGGSAMAAAGVPSRMSVDGLAVIGLVEGLRALKLVEERAAEAARLCAAARPDAVVLIDSWGFTLRCARAIRPLLPGVPLVKMVGPQVWATRPGRARTVAQTYDALLCIHPFEVPYYQGTGLPVTVIGNPAVGRDMPGDGPGFTARQQLGGHRQLLLLPGSRPSEITRVAPVLEDAAARLWATRPDLVVTVVLSPAVGDLVRDRASRWTFPHRLVGEADKADAFAAATAALACSGTVTTEVALQGTPVVAGYRIGFGTWALVRLLGLMKNRYITLMNIAVDREVSPEFLQTRFTPERLVRALEPLLDDPAARTAQILAQNAALDAMGRGGEPAATRAARALADLIAATDRARTTPRTRAGAGAGGGPAGPRT